MKKIGKLKLDYRYVIVAICFLLEFTALGFVSSNKSLYLGAITEALGIKRSLFSINDSCRFITTSVVNLFFGALIKKFGSKKLIVAGLLSLITAVLIYAYATNIFVFYLGGVFLGIGFAWTGTTVVGYIANRWCKENKGTVMGIILSANGLGGAVAAQIVTPIIYQKGTLFGYRDAYRLVALFLAAVAVLTIVFFKDSPTASDDTDIPKKKKPRGNTWCGITFSQAIRKPYFYISSVCIFLTGMCLQGVNGVAGTHMKDAGLDVGYVATVLSVHSLALTAAKFLTGISYDKLGLRITMLSCNFFGILAFITLGLTAPTASGTVCAMIYGVASSFSLPLETIMLPLIASDLYGEISFAKMLGIFVSINTAGYAVGAPLSNAVFDRYGTYKPLLFASAIFLAVIAVMFQFVLTAAGKVRKEVEQSADTVNA